MRLTVISVYITIFVCMSDAATLRVGTGQTYANIQAAAQAATSGDTILVSDGTYAGGQWISNLNGNSNDWITILAAPGASPIWDGGAQAWHLSNAAYVRVSGMTFQNQTSNGVNVDDSGTYETPAHNVIFERCTFRRMNATGNNDLLKLSGLDTFEIRDCVFEDGAAGGSGVDMVGCHRGLFTQNRFARTGSNAIQAKGGTRHITIERNFFENCGARTMNLGGSTGLPYFRPDTAHYEAADLYVYANVIIGSEAAVAYVGCTNVNVINNTIFKPTRWVIRILQETVDTNRFVKCGNSTFRNNIVYRGAISTDCNVGENTDPASFVFSNNLWYNFANPSSSAPRDLPVADANNVVGQDPLFADSSARNFSITTLSPAARAGYTITEPAVDYVGNAYAAPRSIGALEAGSSAVRTGGARNSRSVQPVSAAPRLSWFPDGGVSWGLDGRQVQGGSRAAGLYVRVFDR